MNREKLIQAVQLLREANSNISKALLLIGNETEYENIARILKGNGWSIQEEIDALENKISEIDFGDVS